MAGVARANKNLKTLGFHNAKVLFFVARIGCCIIVHDGSTLVQARFKMNKLTTTPTLVGTDLFGNKYYEDHDESFGARKHAARARVCGGGVVVVGARSPVRLTVWFNAL